MVLADQVKDIQMGIWNYQPSRNPSENLVLAITRKYCNEMYKDDVERIVSSAPHLCHYCSHSMTLLTASEWTQFTSIDEFRHLNVCPRCGWWFYIDMEEVSKYSEDYLEVDTSGFCFGAYNDYQVRVCDSSLKELDLSDQNQPLEDVRQYLLAKNEARYDVHPRLFEEVVGSVYRNLGYRVLVTSYSNDGGLDLILYDSSGSQVGVQVKRYKNLIKVSHIRELLGALVVSNLTKGVFVTTSDFQRGAHSLRRKVQPTGYTVELVNGRQFLDAMGVGSRSLYSTVKQFEDQAGAVKTVPVGHLIAPWSGIA